MGRPLLKAQVSLRVYNYMGSSPKFGQQNLIGSRRLHFDMRRHMRLHVLLENLYNESFSICLPKL